MRDWRVGQLRKLPNVEIFMASEMTADTVRETGAGMVALATGAVWRRDGSGRYHDFPLPGAAAQARRVLTPDDIMAGAEPEGPVAVYDDDHYYMGGAIAEKLARDGHAVSLVTPARAVSSWTEFTLEIDRIQTRMRELGVTLHLSHAVTRIDEREVEIEDMYSRRAARIEAGAVVMVTAQDPVDGLYRDLMADEDANRKAGIRRVSRIGDCYGPGPIAAAVFGGYRYARELGEAIGDGCPWKRETVELAAEV